MIGFIVGVALIVVAVFIWVGHIPVEHAIALLMGAIGVLTLAGRWLWRDWP